MELTNASSNKSSTFKGKLYTLIFFTTIFVIAILLTPGLAKLIPQLLLGAMFAHSLELAHELGHHVHFRNERLNRRVGVLLALPMLVSYSSYKASHGHHHKALGTADDKESFAYDYDQITTIKGFIYHLSMVNHYWSALRNMRAAVFGEVRENVPSQIAWRIRNEFRLMAGLIIIMLTLSVTLQTSFFLNVWLLPLLLGTAPIHALIELPEHLGCDSSTTNVFKNTRTIRTNKFVEWLVNGNNWHVEHHENPAVPMEYLRERHKQLAPKIEHLEPSYREFYSKLFIDLISRSFRVKVGKPHFKNKNYA
ncbi:MAG: fatty acid desaturase [Nostoc sp. DedSLP03]|uniref:fatty acid desaturase family protein n=1 Tax=Nostoc sp. DedSLP03 TaxID=3075400 RepID=UPI002AD2FC91|nr:fatty acid desaturase [Nostoc sp. DedSLP03]MDZ7970555.1 fatty acid desaturase [Nostoc sp. DedSLP03]